MKYFGLIFALVLTACMGREKDVLDDKVLTANLNELEIQSEGKPSLLVYSALWCIPCRVEVEYLNKAQEIYGDRLNIVGVLTEGENKGEPIKAGQVSEFSSMSGEKPTYLLTTDLNWAQFQAFDLDLEQQLPTMLFIDSQDRLVNVVQRGLSYETELIPAIESLISGGSVQDFEEDDEGSKKMLIEEWMDEVSTESTSKSIAKKMKESWNIGVKKWEFKPGDVPFLKGQLTVEYEEGFPYPKLGYWSYVSKTGSNCYLRVPYNKDGSIRGGTTGVCR